MNNGQWTTDNGQFINQLKTIMLQQIETVKELLKVLEEQHEYVVKNDVFKMESCVEKIQECNKKNASIELKRRELTKDFLKDKTFSKLIEELNDKEIEKNFRNIRKVLEEVRLQKDTNDLLIKQGLAFTNKMLVLLNPDRQAKTYNAYGKVGR
ncbi:flagellar protein FlgN [Clostridium sp. ZS2-4]|uniref:flagellar protein FlgN n=1 Tax=Clostridium sp. ZS2-4 TaxID=2987703 RepID=UPI00227B38F7|nr:flagellar protein FlgN [Clostridium sp. ZS2-4]MCY6353957.1 flagellar protein FlgN [Clostridium sp. ZS2-4]